MPSSRDETRIRIQTDADAVTDANTNANKDTDTDADTIANTSYEPQYATGDKARNWQFKLNKRAAMSISCDASF